MWRVLLIFFQLQSVPSAFSWTREAWGCLSQPVDSRAVPLMHPSDLGGGSDPDTFTCCCEGWRAACCRWLHPGALGVGAPTRSAKALTRRTCGTKGAVGTRVLLTPWKAASRN